MLDAQTPEYTYLNVPPIPQLKSCPGLVLAGMAIRAKVGMGGLEEAVELLEMSHSGDESSNYRFHVADGVVVVEIEARDSVEASGDTRWRAVVELAP